MDPRVRLAAISGEPIDVGAAIEAVSDPRAGGTGVFVGHVRRVDDGRDVNELTYQAHPSAADQLAVVLQGCLTDAVIAIAAVHRTGQLLVGDVAVVVAVSSVHRADALSVCTATIDTIKTAVPIWKRQSFDDGDSEWVGL